jgi:hypothetical protein
MRYFFLELLMELVRTTFLGMVKEQKVQESTTLQAGAETDF